LQLYVVALEMESMSLSSWVGRDIDSNDH